MNFNTPYGHMVHEYYVAKAREISRRRQQRLKRITTREQAELYVSEARKKISTAFGEFPEKTPLDARCVGRIGRPGLTIEKIIFESRPGFPVTGLLYLPEQIEEKAPAVLGVCGHSGNGKAAEPYQLFCQSLALKGFVVFMYDPISQGERLQYLDAADAEGVSGFCTREHNMMGKQLRLCGDFFGAWRAWDGIRALDYLTSRPEVDPSRIGVTGNSGGGTMTSYINALDPRPTMVAPGCYITTYLRNLENELPCDSEQIPPGILAAGCEMADLLIARAPRPTLIMGQQNDFFDIRGTREAYEDVKHIYSLLGKAGNVKLFIGPTEHGYSVENREQMYAFFGNHAGIDVDAREPAEANPLPEAEILCAPDGQVKNLPDSRLVHDFLADQTARLKAARKPLRGEELKRKLLHELRVDPPAAVPHYRVLRQTIHSLTTDEKTGREIVAAFSNFAIETEPGIVAVLRFLGNKTYFQLPQGKQCRLYLPHQSTETELEKTAEELDASGNLFGLDVRGIGTTCPLTCDHDQDYFAPYGQDFFYASQGIMLNQPYLGGKISDTLAAIKLLETSGYEQIGLVGRGLGAIVATFAALFSESVEQLQLINSPESYEEMIRSPITKWPLSHMLPGILEYTDLPEIRETLKSKITSFDAPVKELVEALTRHLSMSK